MCPARCQEAEDCDTERVHDAALISVLGVYIPCAINYSSQSCALTKESSSRSFAAAPRLLARACLEIRQLVPTRPWCSCCK